MGYKRAWAAFAGFPSMQAFYDEFNAWVRAHMHAPDFHIDMDHCCPHRPELTQPALNVGNYIVDAILEPDDAVLEMVRTHCKIFNLNVKFQMAILASKNNVFARIFLHFFSSHETLPETPSNFT